MESTIRILAMITIATVVLIIIGLLFGIIEIKKVAEGREEWITMNY